MPVDHLIINQEGEIETINGFEDSTAKYKKIKSVFDTGRDDSYEPYKVAIFHKADVDMATDSDEVTHDLKAFSSSLRGHGFELWMCCHENGKSLYAAGEYKENEFVSEKGIPGFYGPVVLSAQIAWDDDPVDVSSSAALRVAEIIAKAKGVNVFGM